MLNNFSKGEKQQSGFWERQRAEDPLCLPPPIWISHERSRKIPNAQKPGNLSPVQIVNSALREHTAVLHSSLDILHWDTTLTCHPLREETRDHDNRFGSRRDLGGLLDQFWHVFAHVSVTFNHISVQSGHPQAQNGLVL